MKIDIHVHTRKTKSGDPATRDITAKQLSEVIQSTDVSILAITNHNLFDLEQYNEACELVEKAVQIWPGVELDVVEGGRRAHLLVIVSPKKRMEFSAALGAATKRSTPDNFETSIDDLVAAFDSLDPVYVAHYLGKKPCLDEESINKLSQMVKNPKRIIKEAANSISAGIFIAHGHSSIYGSDLRDWSKYPEATDALPELRLPVDSFEHFCLLLEKDTTTINTALSRKHSESLKLAPFGDDTEITIPAYNDINVLFGPKGTGKTKILEAIAQHYSKNGVKATVFQSGSGTLEDRFDLKGKKLAVDLNEFGINYCTNEIGRLKVAAELDVTSLGEYREYFKSEVTNKNAQRIKIKDLSALSHVKSKGGFNDFAGARGRVEEMIKFLKASGPVAEVWDSAAIQETISNLSVLAGRLAERAWEHFADWKGAELANSATRLFGLEVTRKTGARSKPTATGFVSFARNRLQIKRDALEVCASLSTKISTNVELVGFLGPGKGDLECETSLQFQDGTIRDPQFAPVRGRGVKKFPLQEFARTVKDVESSALQCDLFDHVSELADIDGVDDIQTVYGLLLFRRRFILGGEPYAPSSGECSMLNLHAELVQEKDVYLLDEPERSLGNEYINDAVIPLINERARQGKRIFIATHDANIAVRTLPYNSIYRCHNKAGYATYVGNPFSNSLVCQVGTNEALEWREVSMRTLEGGEQAFGERGGIYGSH